MTKAYRALLQTPGVTALIIAGSLARLPQTMVGIGIIVMLVQKTGLYWLAGAVGGTFTLANALVGPRISRLVDRHGQSRVIPPVAAFSLGMLLALIIAVYANGPVPLLFLLAALAGTLPSLPALIRARWTHLFRGKPELHTAFSLDTVLVECAFIIGPPLAIALSTSLFAEAAPLFAVAMLTVGITAFLKQRETEPPAIPVLNSDSTSALRIPGLRVIVLALMALGVVGSSIDVTVVAFAKAQGWPPAASFILATYAAGSMLAGITFGSLKIGASMQTQFLMGTLVLAATAWLPILAPGVYALAAILFVAGMAFAPTFIVVMNLGTMVVPAAKMTEGLTWMSTGVGVGMAAGGFLAGVTIDHFGARAGFAVAMFAGVSMVAIVLAGMRTLRAA